MDEWCGDAGGRMMEWWLDGWRRLWSGRVMVVLLDGWAAEAHHHAGLAVAAAGGGEEGERERDEMPGPRGKWRLG